MQQYDDIVANVTMNFRTLADISVVDDTVVVVASKHTLKREQREGQMLIQMNSHLN